MSRGELGSVQSDTLLLHKKAALTLKNVTIPKITLSDICRVHCVSRAYDANLHWILLPFGQTEHKLNAATIIKNQLHQSMRVVEEKLCWCWMAFLRIMSHRRESLHHVFCVLLLLLLYKERQLSVFNDVVALWIWNYKFMKEERMHTGQGRSWVIIQYL